MREFKFSIALSAQKTHSIYRGQSRYIVVETDTGLKLQLPAVNFRPYVGNDGIHGRFTVRIDADNKIIALQKI